MVAKHELIGLACQMIDTLGPDAGARMETIVAAHVEDGDREGAEFWGEVAQMVRHLEDATMRARTLRAVSE